MATCSGWGKNRDDPREKQRWNGHSPLGGQVPTRMPIFSVFFVENVPTLHTNKLCGWVFKGSIKRLLLPRWGGGGRHLLSSPPPPAVPRHNQDAHTRPFPSLGQRNTRPQREWPQRTVPGPGQACLLGKEQPSAGFFPLHKPGSRTSSEAGQ